MWLAESKLDVTKVCIHNTQVEERSYQKHFCSRYDDDADDVEDSGFDDLPKPGNQQKKTKKGQSF